MGKFRRKTLVVANLGIFIFIASVSIHAAPERTVTVELGQHFGEFFVISRGDTVCLQSTVIIEQKSGDNWQKVPVSNLELRSTCLPSPSPRAVELKANTTLHPPPWTGNYCSSQCPVPCRLDGAAPPGIYRFAITSCDGAHRYFSSTFEKPK